MPKQSSTAISSTRITSHGTSSSANSDEDWTKISDKADRRRVQNRIAQRNYRKKLKRRLENLERKVGSSSASPPQMHAELQHQQDRERSPEIIHRQPPPRLLQNQHAQPTGGNLIFGHPGSLTGPLLASHAYQQPYRPVYTAGDQFGYYLFPVPVTVPPTTRFHEGDAMSPFNMGYSEIGHASHGYEDANSHVSTTLTISTIANSHLRTPSLSLSYEHSTTCSESGYQYPTTPSQT